MSKFEKPRNKIFGFRNSLEFISHSYISMDRYMKGGSEFKCQAFAFFLNTLKETSGGEPPSAHALLLCIQGSRFRNCHFYTMRELISRHASSRSCNATKRVSAQLWDPEDSKNEKL